MCGIVLLHGPQAEARLPACLDRLRHRGPDDRGSTVVGQTAVGFTRLAINGDGPTARQPFSHGELIGGVNGEIYNHEGLVRSLDLSPTGGDAQVVLPLLEARGPRAIDDLDGFYSAIAYRPSTGELRCLRDHMGKKPLFVGRSGDELFVASELKALTAVDWFEPVPRGVTQVDLSSGHVTRLAAHRALAPRKGIGVLLERAVRKRVLPCGRPVGVFLSGGLDSSLVAAFVSRVRDDATYFTLGDAGGPDREAVEAVVSHLGLKDVRTVPLPAASLLPDLIRTVVHATESYNPSIISNGLATFLLAEAARAAGIKVVLTGEGADELFGGYHTFGGGDPWREVRDQLIDDMQFTELRRLDLACMAHSVEARCPFLDRAVRSFSDQLGFQELYDGGENKITLRRSFQGILPASVLHRRKTSFDVGSGIRGKVVRFLQRNGMSEREELKRLWHEQFRQRASHPYFHAYPVFDAAIDRRGVVHS